MDPLIFRIMFFQKPSLKLGQLNQLLKSVMLKSTIHYQKRPITMATKFCKAESLLNLIFI